VQAVGAGQTSAVPLGTTVCVISERRLEIGILTQSGMMASATNMLRQIVEIDEVLVFEDL